MSNVKMPPQSLPTLSFCLCSLSCALNTVSSRHDDNCTAERSNKSHNISLIRFSISRRGPTLSAAEEISTLFFVVFLFFCLTSTSNDVVFALRLPGKRMPLESISSTLSTFLSMIIQINNH